MSNENPVEYTGVVVHAHGLFDGWRAGRLRTTDEDLISFAGTCDCNVGESWTLHGAWGAYRGNRQLKVAWATKNMAVDQEGIQKILERDPRFKLIGPVWSRALSKATEAMGGDLSAILGDPFKIADLKKRAESIRSAEVRLLEGPYARGGRIPRKAIRLLVEQWEENRAEHEAKASFIALGLPPRAVDRLWKNLGQDGKRVLNENPWVVCDLMDGISFEMIDQIAMKQLGLERGAAKRLEAGIIETLRLQREGGHTWISKNHLVSRTMATLDIGRMGDREAVTRRLDDLLESQDDRLAVSTLEPIGTVISVPKYHKAETAVASFFAHSLKDEPNPHFVSFPFSPGELSRLIKPDHKGVTRMPNEAQAEAILKATQKKRIVITGPAGAGKTATVAALIKVYQSRNKNVSLAAPTGKAAKRLLEVMDQAGPLDRPLSHGPATIHRLLECKGLGLWGRDRLKPLHTDVLIVDESMCDAELSYRMIDALPEHCAIVLVGDPHQLPSVGPGAILRDLIEGGRCDVARLDKVLRHAGVMRANAKALLSGVMTKTTQEVDENGLVFNDDGTPVIPWLVEDGHRDPRTALRSITERFEKLLVAGGRDAVLELQVLSPQYKGVVGIDNLNKELQRIAQRVLYGVEIEPQTEGDDKVKWLVGDKIVQTKNDYELDLMNGTLAIVVDKNPEWIILDVERVKGRFTKVVVPREESEGLRLAWAMSIHRVQGSQFEHVVAACHGEANPKLLNRKLVYTAATRATKTVALIGDQGGLKGALMRTDTDFRRTFMAPTALLEQFAREAGIKKATVS